MFNLPEKLTPQSLAALVQDRRYRDRRDPEHKAYRDFVSRAYRSFYGEAGGGVDRGAARAGGGIVHVRGYTRVVDGKLQHVQAYDRRGPWSDRPTSEIRQQIAVKEGSANKANDGYGEFRKGRNGNTRLDALGRYQIQRDTLRGAGWEDGLGKWTEKARQSGVESDEDFLTKPDAQEKAFDDVLSSYEQEADKRGLFERVRRGEKITGIKGEITVTEAGIIAAMHRRGGPDVAKYFAEADKAKREKRGIRYDKPGVFKQIETRLREFQNVPYTRVTPPPARP